MDVTSCQIRRAAPADLTQIMRLETLCFDHPAEQFDEAKLRYLIQSPRLLTTVAEQNRKVVGWSCGFSFPRHKPRWGRIFALAVDPAARGRKIGERLLTHTVATLSNPGEIPVFLEVRPDNTPALRLYQRLGFVTCKNLPDFYAPDHAAVRMRRDAYPLHNQPFNG